MKQYWAVFLLVILISIVGTIIFMEKYHSPKEVYTGEEYRELIHDIDSLSFHINTINKERDSLRSILDTTKSKVIIIEKEYEKDYIDITNQSISDDVEFFINYLEQVKY